MLVDPVKTINVAVIGAGTWGERVIVKFLSDQKFGLNHVVTKNQRSIFNTHIEYSTNYKDVTTNPNIDLVYIATPPQLQKQIIEACIYQEKNIICEKPLFDNLNDLEEIKSLLHRWKYNKLFLVNYIHLFNKTFTDWVDEVVKTNKKGIFYINIRGSVVRDYMSIKLDYGPHAVAIMHYLIEKLEEETSCKAGGDIFVTDNFSYILNWETSQIKDVSVTFCDEVGETLTWRDDKNFDSLNNLLTIAAENINKPLSNFDLAYNVGKVLLC